MGFFERLFGKRKVDIEKRFVFEGHRSAITGTMSKFYRALDQETNRRVGLKIIDVDKMNQVEERYRAYGKAGIKPSEGEIALDLSHPNIVVTYETGVTTRKQPFLVMEYLEGTGLDNMIILAHNNLLAKKEDPLSGHCLDYIRQCAEGLQYLHEHGYIHRDYSPRNLLFDGDRSTLKMIDFGLTVPNRPPFTDPGGRTGNANYMAPELIRRRPTSERVDIFAFGVSMYELCTRGELPWPRGQSGLAAMTHDQPAARLADHVPNINPKLAEAIHRCILPDPKDRCPSMQEFLRMISRIESEFV